MIQMTEITQLKVEILDLQIGPILLLIDKGAINRIIEIIQGINNKIPSYANLNFNVAINVGIDTEKETDKLTGKNTVNNIVQIV